MTVAGDAGAAILKALKFRPGGMTVTEIARKMRFNRNSTAKHLEILRAAGKVDTRQVGTAKVYSLAQRVPLSAFLCFTRNMILILDLDLIVVQANDQYLAFAGLTKQELIGQNIREGTLPIISTPEALTIIESTQKEQVVSGISIQRGREELYYRMEVIPTIFDSGESGLTIVLQDFTEKKRHLKNMEFLARTAMELVDLPPETDIFRYIAERVADLLPERPRCWVQSFDEVKGGFFMRAIAGQAFREEAAQLAGGHDLVGMAFPLYKYFSRAPFFLNPSTMKTMREFRQRPFFEDEEVSFYTICMQQFPQEVCDTFLQTCTIAKIYLTGLVWQEQLFGVVGIGLGPDEVLENRQAIESFLRQASIAVSRRMTEERLSRSERRFEELVTLADQPAAVIDRDGRITLLNPRFSEMFGYTREDIPTGEEWFLRAFPDPEYRREAVSAWEPNLRGTAVPAPKAFVVRCGNGEEKNVVFRSILLSDGTRVITCMEKAGGR
ncbi:MAG: histidine kinase [Methanoculleus sp. SDB]|nr:MAG: histidine kinase [Methanoculleus sp. SDB]